MKNIKEIYSEYKYYILFFLIGVVIIGYFYFNRDKEHKPSVKIIHDTCVVIRYQTELKHDTIIRWYEKVVYKESEPVVIYQQKIDSVFLEKIKFQDVMLKVEKNKKQLHIYAINENDSLIKEIFYEDVGNDFTATSNSNGGIFVKSKRFYFNGIEPFVQYEYNLNQKQQGYNFGIKTGVNYNDFIFLKPYISYNKDKDFNTGIELSLKLIK